MKVKRTLCLVFSLLLIPALLAGCGSVDKSYPYKNINGYIAWAAGGGTDSLTRTIAPIAEKNLGRSFILSNRPGGTGFICTQHVYSQPADGYSILFHAENPLLYKLLGLGEIDYDNFIPIAVLARNIAILVVPADSPYQTYQDFIDDCKARPGRVNVGATGTGGLPFNSLSLVKMIEDIDYNLVNFDGDGTLQPALIGGQLDISVVGQAAAVQYVQSGHLRALGVFHDTRMESLPDVPALGELNDAYKGRLEKWGPFYGAFVKEGTDPEIVEILSDAFVTAANDEAFLAFCDNLGIEKLGFSGQEAVDFLNEWQSMTAWTLYEAGATGGRSPADFGIDKP